MIEWSVVNSCAATTNKRKCRIYQHNVQPIDNPPMLRKLENPTIKRAHINEDDTNNYYYFYNYYTTNTFYLSINQSINQSIDPSINQWINQVMLKLTEIIKGKKRHK